ncbi:hypothetical protein DFH07DRAFT_511252 [Mycena maculata]|uniref:Uncharacterized protein n=1 Tax=Mycena maculata TaxID=230809 RepID=A0AAD7J0G3_9AGAR|nr:hypothetical protein DFH07DRAFT_511252 [Mycena maculata]
MPTFWSGQTQIPIFCKLLHRLTLVLKDLGIDSDESLLVDTVLDNEGVDSLVYSISTGVVGWSTTHPSSECWYRDISEVVRLLRRPQAETILTTSWDLATSPDLLGLIPNVDTPPILDILTMVTDDLDIHPLAQNDNIGLLCSVGEPFNDLVQDGPDTRPVGGVTEHVLNEASTSNWTTLSNNPFGPRRWFGTMPTSVKNPIVRAGAINLIRGWLHTLISRPEALNREETDVPGAQERTLPAGSDVGTDSPTSPDPLIRTPSSIPHLDPNASVPFTQHQFKPVPAPFPPGPRRDGARRAAGDCQRCGED